MKMKIFHDSRNINFREPFGAAPVKTGVSVSLEVKDLPEVSVRLMLWKGEEVSPRYLDMKEDEPGSGRYSVAFKAPEHGCLLWYSFEIGFNEEGELKTVYYGNNDECLGGEGRIYDSGPKRYQITVYKPSVTPGWYKNGIVYQIFPDRFARDDDWRERCEAANFAVNARRSDIKRTIQEDWNRPAYYVREASGEVKEWPFYGGSFRGIEGKLDYLKSLGVTAIYLNPIFEASSNHRYDTGDYMKADPALGSEEDFVSLAESARKKGIRIILDGVFSHTGADSRYFNKFGNYPAEGDGKSPDPGAWNDETSIYRSWYKFDDNEKCGYKSWWGVEDLPEVNENDPGYEEFILGDKGVIAHWLGLGASGWRLDVADELPDSFIEKTRARIKSETCDALLIGEVWEDASNKVSYGARRRFLLGEELDGTMNYPLRQILLDYINYTISSGKAVDRIMNLAENYPREIFYSALNLAGSHDRERIITLMAATEDYDSAVRKVKMISTLLYALPGVPCIYYGDEAGLEGGSDPANRSGFPWGHENHDLTYHYRMLGLLYSEHPALAGGNFEMISGRLMNDDVLAFTRTGPDAGGCEETILVLANRSYGDSNVDLSGLRGSGGYKYAVDLLTSEEFPIDENGSLGTVRMERLSAKLLSLRKEMPECGGLGRAAGVLCHISSLPGSRLGKPAKDFADFLSDATFGVWQVLPLNPAGTGGSPYSSYASFAGDPRFIDRENLPDKGGCEDFVCSNSYWLHDYIAYMLIKGSQDGRPWYEWPDEYRNAESRDVLDSLDGAQRKQAEELCLEQYYFDVQWRELKEYANSKGILMMGDLPMYMAADSADVWANRELFMIDNYGRLNAQTGVPPDAFSNEGQNWGNPLYDWEKLKETGMDWWLKRIRHCADRFDILRIDHFRGLSGYYAIPAGGSPAAGRWQHGPGLAFMSAVTRMMKDEGLELQLVAEDLGFLDADVKNLLKLSGLPGMDIWQFSADEMMRMSRDDPVRAANRVFYTGTHDNNTLVGYLMNMERAETSERSADTAANDC